MTEQDLWKRLYTASKGLAHVTRIENSATFGVPDVAGTYKGKQFWLEFKIMKGTHILFQPTQIAWMLQEINAGGEVHVLVADGRQNATEMYMYHASEIIKPEYIISYNGKPAINLRNLPGDLYRLDGYVNEKTYWVSILMNI